MNSVFRFGRLATDAPGQASRANKRRRDAFGMSGPVLLWAAVLAVTMLSFYVHLLNEHLLHAQGLELPLTASDARQAARNATHQMVPSSTLREHQGVTRTAGSVIALRKEKSP